MSTFVVCMNIKPFGSQHMEELDSSKEISDINDPYAMSVMTGREVVGHVPYKISRMSVTNGRNVKCILVVTGNHCCYSLTKISNYIINI